MQDDLIGFLLGALDSSEQQELDRRLAHDADLRREVERAGRLVRPLRAASCGSGVECDPPAGLADRTCSCLWELTGPPRPAGSSPSSRCASGLSATDSLAGRRLEPVERAASARSAGGMRASNSLDFGGGTRQWTMADFVVAAGVCVAAACLFFPALVNSRYTTQMVACQNNQRELSQGLVDYALMNGGRLPGPSATGNTSVAGMYSVLLQEKGLLQDTRHLVCPAKGNSALVITLPSRQELLSAQGPKLVTYLNTMGGDYAYTIGYLKKGRLQPVRHLGRAQMALLADAPIDNLRNVALTNHLNGQNVLFEDGHVKFLTSRIRPGSKADDLFFNDLGKEWAGQHPEDVVLGRSGVSPLPTMHPETMIVPVRNDR